MGMEDMVAVTMLGHTGRKPLSIAGIDCPKHRAFWSVLFALSGSVHCCACLNACVGCATVFCFRVRINVVNKTMCVTLYLTQAWLQILFPTLVLIVVLARVRGTAPLWLIAEHYRRIVLAGCFALRAPWRTSKATHPVSKRACTAPCTLEKA